MGEVPSALSQVPKPDVVQMSFDVFHRSVFVEGLLPPRGSAPGRLMSVRFTLQTTRAPSASETQNYRFVQRYLTLLGRKLTVLLGRGLPVNIATFRMPSSHEIFLGFGEPQHDGMNALYAECRGMGACILWKLLGACPGSFQND
jgi:hypothetical protein